ncbi:hypothetical protein ACFLS9_06370 [Bacteroidota bacterium]
MDDFRVFYITILITICFEVFAKNQGIKAADSTLTSSGNYHYNNQSIVANVASLVITAEEFLYSYEYGPAFTKKNKNSKENYLNYMINEKLLAQYAYQNGIDTLRQSREMITAIHNDLMTEAMFKEEIENNIKLNETEIDTIINRKTITVELKWLYYENETKLKKALKLLQNNTTFDSLFRIQLKRDVKEDDRFMHISLYHLGIRNKPLAIIIDTLTVGNYSKPIHTIDGWYIVKLLSAYKNPIQNEEEYHRLRSESITAAKKEKMDKLSDKYIQTLFFDNKPIINKDAFEILKGYVGKYYLSAEDYEEWKLDVSLAKVMKNTGITDSTIKKITLVELTNMNISLNEFLEWFWIRSQYMKFDKSNVSRYSFSLRKIIMLMVRDELLTEEARRKGFNNEENIHKQLGWWKDKIAFSTLRNELAKSIIFENNELISVDSSQTSKSEIELKNLELSKKIFNLINEMKNKTDVRINHELLNNIPVSSLNDPEAIDVYTVKKGGLIPRTPYPTIDYDWINWE